MERNTFLRAAQRVALVSHVAGATYDSIHPAQFIASLQDRGFRIIPFDGTATRWFVEHQIEGDPITTADGTGTLHWVHG